MSVAVSIVIPIFNAEKYLESCLDQLLCQSETNFEIICVNDGSKDNSEAILTEYAHMDRRIRYVTQENKGAGEARNHGLELANGEYVLFLDADDCFEPRMIELLLNKARKHNADVVICRSDAFSEVTGAGVAEAWRMPDEAFRGKECFSPQEMSDILFQMVQGWPWDKLFRTEFIRTHKLTYPDLPNSHDLVFVFQGLVSAEIIAFESETLVHRRMNVSGSISNSRADSWESPYKAVLMITKALRLNHLLDIYERSLCIWTWDFFLWNMCTLPLTPRKLCYKAMQKEWIPTLKLQRYSNGYSRSQRLQLYIVRFFPYWVFSFLKRLRSLFKTK